MKTNSLDDYIAPCFRVDAVKATYSHFLLPVEGMQNWPVSDRVRPLAPGYVRMPGRPKKERRRESTEKPKPSKLSRVGTTIRCRICKGIGHNRSSCAKRNDKSGTVPVASASAPPTGQDPSAPPTGQGPSTNASIAAAPNAMVVVSTTQQSCSSAHVVASSRKRTSNLSASTSTSQVKSNAWFL